MDAQAVEVLPTVAYLDPGTGSMVLQLVIGGVLGGLLAIKLLWKRVIGFFTGKRADSDGASSGGSATSASDRDTK